MGLRATGWVSDVVLEKTNLAGTSKAVFGGAGAAFLNVLLTHCISKHFSLFTMAPQASLKALGMSLKLSRRETSTFTLLGTQPVRNIKEVNCQWIAAGGAVSDFDSLFVVWVSSLPVK